MQNATNRAQRNEYSYCNFNLKIGTSNIQGQGTQNEKKLRKVNRKFENANLDILFVQEARSTGEINERKKWEKLFKTKDIYLTQFGGDSVGVGIILKNGVNFQVQHVLQDPNGRYIGLIGDHEQASFLL